MNVLAGFEDSAREKKWQNVVRAANEFQDNVSAFLADDRDAALKRLRIALSLAGERGAALQVIELLDESERIGFVESLVDLISVTVREHYRCVPLLLSMDRAAIDQRVIARIDKILETADDEQFLRLGELLYRMDSGHLRIVIERALSHPDPEIIATGRFLNELLDGPSSVRAPTISPTS
jgi:hypothetical protein